MPDNEQEVKEKIATRLKEFGLTRFDDGAYRESAAGIYQLVLSSLPGELTLTKNPAPCYAAPLGTCPTLNKDCQDCER